MEGNACSANDGCYQLLVFLISEEVGKTETRQADARVVANFCTVRCGRT